MSKKRRAEVDEFDFESNELESDELPQPSKSAPKYKIVKVYLLDRDEVRALLEASTSPYPDQPDKPFNLNYSTYTPEEAAALERGNYRPRRSRKKK